METIELSEKQYKWIQKVCEFHISESRNPKAIEETEELLRYIRKEKES